MGHIAVVTSAKNIERGFDDMVSKAALAAYIHILWNKIKCDPTYATPDPAQPGTGEVSS